ncbi:MAG: ABC transporter permease subunit, partial [Burkholderiaceae bacterium]|nr:ABC transporter permease subunit [Burkholderiaceae bacterium]
MINKQDFLFFQIFYRIPGNRAYIELFRAIPLLVLLLWVFYGLPVIIGLQMGVFVAGVVSLSLSDSAFEAEVFRAGIQSVPKGQIEAAK